MEEATVPPPAPPQAPAAAPPAPTHPQSGKKALGLVVSLAALAGAVLFGWSYLRNAALNPLSQDAVITADTVNIAAAVPGRIAAIAAVENGSVRAGEVLFTLDPTTYRLQADQAAADLKIAEAALADRRRAMAAEQSNAIIAGEQVSRARSNLELASQTLARLQALRPKGYVSAQQVDDAATATYNAEISLRQALHQQTAADALISNVAAATALVEARRAALALTERGLADTQVRAPFDGKVVGLDQSPGGFVISGQSLFTLINTEAWFASAAFLETELPGIAAGNCVTVYTLADRTRKIRGRVEGIGWGITSTDVINLPFKMPIVPKSLDWVRVAQRFPVRVRLLDPPADLMRIGASATVTVHHGSSC